MNFSIFIYFFIQTLFLLTSKAQQQQQQQQCPIIAYFNVNNCGADIKYGLKPAANPYLPIYNNDNHQLCVPDGYNGNFYLDDGKQAPSVSSISFTTTYNNVNGNGNNNNGQNNNNGTNTQQQKTILVFYQTRNDDKPFHPGRANHLPDLAPLATVRFADQLPNSAFINEQSSAASVIQTTNGHNSLYITYCP